MTAGDSGEQRSMRQLLALLRPRWSRAQVLVGVLCAIVGFAVAVTVNVQRSPQALGQASTEDLVRILSDLTQRSERLRAQIAQLQAEHDALAGSGDRSQAAIDDAHRRADVLGILAGTTPATGPGITLTITDPGHLVPADEMLDTIEELRDAGAEAIQVGDVRVVASTYFRDDAHGIIVDGVVVRAPYRVVALGDSHTLGDALGIPGGVLDTLAQFDGAVAKVVDGTALTIDALKVLQPPRYAQPAATESPAKSPG
ncbi:MAG: hypothetical protein QOH99_1359 [Frankiaceae bacterium]|nr:hypothetical protein [Frankiaceae bacterium]